MMCQQQSAILSRIKKMHAQVPLSKHMSVLREKKVSYLHLPIHDYMQVRLLSGILLIRY